MIEDSSIFLKFIDEPHRAAIGQICVQWSSLEAMIEAAIWQAAPVRNDIGRSITSQLQMLSKLDLLSTLLHQNHPTFAEPFEKFHQFIKGYIGGQRNAIVHGFWFQPGDAGGLAGVVKFKSQGKLTYQGRQFTVEELTSFAADIADCMVWIMNLCERLPPLQQRPGGLGHATPNPRNPQDYPNAKKLALQPLPLPA